MMKKKNIFASKAMTTGLAIAAVAALGLSGVTGARAALTYVSNNYTSQAQMFDIGVTLMEKSGEATKYIEVAKRDYEGNGAWDEESSKLLEGLDETVVPGKTYNEALAVYNSGHINEYVRVTIKKYWVDKDGNKTQELDPSMIDLHLTENSGWTVDEDASTKERTVLYYNDLLETGDTTAPLSDTISIDGNIATKVTEEPVKAGDYTTITSTYDYDGYGFVLEAKAEAIQSHNADQAAISAWGENKGNFSE
ncbi:MAG: hypothetical protein E7236_06935 [Lachnospiraceae bacterium]|nr:hypothetical protein [Lachnospiraceae bacterium]